MNRDLWFGINLLVPGAACIIMFGQIEWYQNWLDTGHGAPTFLGGPFAVAIGATVISIPPAIFDISKESKARGIIAIVLTVLMWAFYYWIGVGMALMSIS